MRAQVSLLGGFRFLPDAGPSAILTGASQRLLAFLALSDRAVGRSALAGTLWPNSSEARALSSLRSTLSRMDRSSRGAVLASLTSMSLSRDVAVDISDSRALAHRLLDRRYPLPEADMSEGSISALSTDLLPDWYDDWVVIETEAWRQLRLHALEALSARLMEARRFSDAAGAALAAIRVEPLRESAHAALVRVHLAEGNQSEALMEFESYSVFLRKELDLEPTRRLCDLVRDVRQK